MMKKNVGTADRIIRIVGAAILGLLFWMQLFTGTLAIVLLIGATILLMTALLGICPIYQLLGINTRTKEAKNEFHEF